MMKLIKLILLLISILFLIYILLPPPDFPKPLPDSITSTEPADVETPLRRGYYTNFTRGDVMNHYFVQFSKANGMNILLPTYNLNYPPEEAQTLIRDQARSTFLEEIVHPFKDSLYVSGFEPREAKDVIVQQGKSWRQKVTVRYVPGNRFVEAFFAALSMALIFILSKEYLYTCKQIKK